MARHQVTRDDLAGVARTALGRGRTLASVERLAGGSRKGVYRLTMDDDTTAIAYLWGADENYWPAAANDNDERDPFTSSAGLDRYETARNRLDRLGLRVPAIYHRDRSHTHYPADLIVIEDFPGENLEQRLERDPAAATPTMERLADDLDRMRHHHGPTFGKVALVEAGGTARRPTCERAVLDLAERCLAEAAVRDPRIAEARDRLDRRLHELAAAVQPRAEYSVVHGELGMDHVLIDPDNNPVLIDIEGLMYFDVEWEHVFLRIRLGAEYHRVATDGLDEARLAFYLLAQRLSLTAGPLRLLDGDFPDRAFMQAIAEYNLNEALALAR
ncbi:aminoglycoside phosphotransferase family protein [Actinoplanes sp. KI2]|uniref:phosphotransferase family protein n=1 Tax=Actinoplanes sp. KI2 TaxID=2983315 RepID=UPI0021D58E35|nr:aminoglycoside phosphotransferase family protein [Actinoplanes sp. KI2]MCU7726825.1 aminoglycoside phosphotransferase family protein [Actinoplanes sp. KI2]